jgi:ATP-dependent RNA helicase DeaD
MSRFLMSSRFAGTRLAGVSPRFSLDEQGEGGTAVLDREDAAIEEVLANVGDETESAVAETSEDVITFASLGLSPALLESIAAVGYEVPSPIQERTIPVLLNGDDVIAQAQTGSGKTAAFGLPIIETIDPSVRGVQALILCPTRELAIQVSEALHKYGRHKRVETLPIYGGQAYERQFRGLQRGVQIVVGTPGRVMDHMRRNTLDLSTLKFFVLDEADEMLDMGFVDDIEWVLQQVPAERQTALFSATMPPRIADLARKYMNDPQRISVRGKELTVSQTQQFYYEIPQQRKVDALTRILDAEVPSSAMIFCRTKHGVDQLGESLLARGFAAETLHGDLSQAQRDRVMRRFRASQADILIATDVAARGLDIPEVSHVINFDIPESPETYVHRIGRTGRAGRDGVAITLVTPRESRWLRQVERITKAKIEFKRLPTAADVNERRRDVLKETVAKVVEAEGDGLSSYLDTVRSLAEDHDPLDIAAALLKLYADETGRAEMEQANDDVAAFSGSGPRPQRGPAEGGMTRLFVNIGRNFRVRPQDIVGAIANEADVPGRAIGAIDIHDSYTFVDVPSDAAEHVVAVLSQSTIKGKPVNVEISNEPASESRGGGGGGNFRGGQRGGFRGAPRRDGNFRGNGGGTGFRAERERRGNDRRDTRSVPAGSTFNRGAGFDNDRRGPRRER